MSRNIKLKNNSNQNYLFDTGQSAQKACAGRQVKFLDEKSAERFIRHFTFDGKFKALLTDLGVGTHSKASLVQALVKRLQNGRIKVYRLPSGSHSKSVQAGVSLSSSATGNQYKMLPAADALMLGAGKTVKAANIESTVELLQSLNIDGKALDALSSNTKGLPGKDTQLKTIAEKIHSGELALVDLGLPAMRLRPEVNAPDNAANTKPVPLAPEVDPWIEVKLMDENGDPVANQSYTIKDSEDVEHKGKTDAKGVARVSKLAEGDCEIRFDDLEGWS